MIFWEVQPVSRLCNPSSAVPERGCLVLTGLHVCILKDALIFHAPSGFTPFPPSSVERPWNSLCFPAVETTGPLNRALGKEPLLSSTRTKIIFDFYH
ncbi:hypothetical protein AV530_001189 [Patagioenas fasciata monilis]|uniref:Uncharacterized protein n=1 Tax=Patagioenas fasciata monilis TaxID=372326 RepID=A0A1V4KTP6_PATFA|nr:hypothetical protein AV530_001189 [Patagioenas fasciata monilis]